MASRGGGGGGSDFYAVLGLNKECSEADLRNAYKKLAMVFDHHPTPFLLQRDGILIVVRLRGIPSLLRKLRRSFRQYRKLTPVTNFFYKIKLFFFFYKFVAFFKGILLFNSLKSVFSVHVPVNLSVLSDSNKRFLYDVGAYDSDDDENDMGDFLGEMAQMMSQTKPNENGQESFEELQQLFVEMFQSDLDGGGFGGPTSSYKTDGYDVFSASSPSSSSASSQPFCNGNNKRDNSAMSSVKAGTGNFDSGSGVFCFGSRDSGQSSNGSGSNSNSKRRNGRKQKVSSKHDVSSRDAEISAA